METDESGKWLIGFLQKKGHSCKYHAIVPNDKNKIKSEIAALLDNIAVQLIITSGGTGCGKKDVTIDAVAGLLEKKLEGFGELFRMLSYKEIGSAAIMSRALLGIAKGKIVVCVPGSVDAMKMAVQKLLVDELEHLIWESNR
ncbi:MAG: molybdenum cofactor biosynthesis protein MoaB [Planctomycetes bacterium]|nr:molybdenum cofactor biosynthesis protein MoaB [Planctomycetota bacterium]